MNTRKRFAEIDLLRTLSLAGMVIYHFFFVLDFYGVAELSMVSGAWAILARLVQFGFLGLVGVSLALSSQRPNGFFRRQIKRVFKVAFMALLVSAATYMALPGEFVRFGILHLIAVAIFVGAFLSGRKYLCLTLAVAILLITPTIQNMSSQSLLLYFAGSRLQGISSIDHFAIFPWLSVPLIGIAIGQLLYGKGEQPALFKKIPPSAFNNFMSRNSLRIYLLHVPIILLIFIALQIIPLSEFLAFFPDLANIA